MTDPSNIQPIGQRLVDNICVEIHEAIVTFGEEVVVPLVERAIAMGVTRANIVSMLAEEYEQQAADLRSLLAKLGEG